MQTKLMSLLESKTNAVVGLLASWLFTFYGLPLFGIEPNVQQATGITASYFFLSLARSYVVRRVFNRIAHRETSPRTEWDDEACEHGDDWEYCPSCRRG